MYEVDESGLYGDMAFMVAALNGVRPHRWEFGNMPPVYGVTKGDILSVVASIRALQRGDGFD